ncbi:Lrp/AsnC family transcriptional regulator [Fretibacter rubidus]|uniref:Lrp/AsnC family transcriptional regulator n=1 Tax=Fretibacter rubidus TaxID=570162 RepID=UPI003529F8A4
MRLTFKDQQLLGALRGNARATTTDLAKTLGVSRSTLQKRLERLETEGVIAGYTVQLTSEYLDQEIKAHVTITVEPRATDAIIKAMKALDSVRSIYSVSGPYDLIVEVAAMSVTELDRVIDTIIAIEGVERTVSSVILSTRLKR